MFEINSFAHHINRRRSELIAHTIQEDKVHYFGLLFPHQIHAEMTAEELQNAAIISAAVPEKGETTFRTSLLMSEHQNVFENPKVSIRKIACIANRDDPDTIYKMLYGILEDLPDMMLQRGLKRPTDQEKKARPLRFG